MKSGLEGRNNHRGTGVGGEFERRLNEVRPRRPEQSYTTYAPPPYVSLVSMKSGLEGRNNRHGGGRHGRLLGRLNEVRPRRPEQWYMARVEWEGMPVSMKSGLEGRNNVHFRAKHHPPTPPSQ